MSELDDRGRMFENRFALDEANLFKAEARACKRFGRWLADKLGLEGEEAENYAARLVAANLEEPGFDDVLRAVRPDVDQKQGLEMSDTEILMKIDEFFAQAQLELKEEREKSA
jgi:hypothetical protein